MLAAVLAAVGFGQQDVLIHPDRADFTVGEYFLDGMIVVEVMNCPPWEEYLYQSTDNGRTWLTDGQGRSSDTALHRLLSFSADSTCYYFYTLYDVHIEQPNELFMLQYNRDGVYGYFENIAYDRNAHEFAGTTDHLGAGH